MQVCTRSRAHAAPAAGGAAGLARAGGRHHPNRDEVPSLHEMVLVPSWLSTTVQLVTLPASVTVTVVPSSQVMTLVPFPCLHAAGAAGGAFVAAQPTPRRIRGDSKRSRFHQGASSDREGEASIARSTAASRNACATPAVGRLEAMPGEPGAVSRPARARWPRVGHATWSSSMGKGTLWSAMRSDSEGQPWDHRNALRLQRLCDACELRCNPSQARAVEGCWSTGHRTRR